MPSRKSASRPAVSNSIYACNHCIPLSELQQRFDAVKKAISSSTEADFHGHLATIAKLIHVDSELWYASLTLSFYPSYLIPSPTGIARGLPENSQTIKYLSKLLGGIGYPNRQMNSEAVLVVEDFIRKGGSLDRMKEGFQMLFLRLDEALELILDDPDGWIAWKDEVEQRLTRNRILEPESDSPPVSKPEPSLG